MGCCADVVAAVPGEWLVVDDGPVDDGQVDVREAYVAQLLARRDARDAWLPGVRAAVAEREDHPPTRTPDLPSWLTDRRAR